MSANVRPTRVPARLAALVLVAGVALGSLASVALGPHSPELTSGASGDAALAADFRATLADDHGFGQVSLARVRDGGVRYAGLSSRGLPRPTPQTPFELGSVTKTFTGLLLADGVQRGELALDAPVSRYLPELAGSPAGAATLVQLATHSSGLPSLPPDMALPALGASLTNTNPYAAMTTAELLRAAAQTPRQGVGRYAYSNLGMTLLGHAEARAAGAVDWPTLARTRLLGPLGMTSTRFVTAADQLPAGIAAPHADNGWRAAHWFGPAFTPAGAATVTTAADLTTYAQALLDRRAPGMAALTPLSESTGGRVGLAWFTRELAAQPLTWHNGATGGYRSMLALDLSSRTAVVVLNSSTRWVDQPALQLAAAPVGSPLTASDAPDWPTGLPLALGATGLVLVLGAAVQALLVRTRLDLLTAGVTAAAGLVLLLAHGPWVVVPAWTWGGTAGLAVAALALGGRRLRGRAAGRARPGLGLLSLGVAVLVLAGALWTC